MEKLTVRDTWEKLAKVISDMDKISSIKIQETDSRSSNIGGIIYRCNEKIEELMKTPETEFLASAVIRKYFKMVLPAFVVPVTDILSGDTSKIDEIKTIQKALDEDPALDEWKKVIEDFKKATSEIGLEIKMDISDLSAVSDIVYDALTLVNRKNVARVYQVREGQKSGTKPIMLNAIGAFDSIHSAVILYESLPQECFVTFFGLTQTYEQTDDKFDEWYHGRTIGRKYNMIHNRGTGHEMTEEEYISTPDKNSQTIYCLIRDGEDIRLFPMPIDASCYEDKFKSFTNCYGRRSTYAPIQIFFNDTPATTDKDTVLPVVVGKKYWLLNEILDDEQKIWLPLFFLSVKKKFYESGEIQSEKAILPEETAIYTNNSEIAIVPCTREYARYTIEEPKQFFSDKNRSIMVGHFSGEAERFDNAVKLCEFFGITAKDIVDAPFGVVGMSSIKQGINIISKQVGKAYYKIIVQRLIKTWGEMANEAYKWYKQKINENIENIIGKALVGTFPFASTRIHKRSVLNEDGTPKMTKRDNWSNILVPLIEITDIDEGKIQRCFNKRDEELRYFFPPTIVGKHPPVVLAIIPQSANDIAAVCDCETNELPAALRYASFVRNYEDIERTCFSIETTIRIVFGKKEYKKRIK